jgi:hypothetical protein
MSVRGVINENPTSVYNDMKALVILGRWVLNAKTLYAMACITEET